ncbi:MAG TPA: hypothetical protein VFO65_07945, partial [Acidimicrobiales bacterium]|nr:hypothetical protein [Acidimicrobiales bacterium]
GSVGGGSGTASVVFSSPTTIVNGGVTVVDSNGASWQFADSGTVSYDRTFTCDGDEGSHANTAAIVETGQSASASVDVTCHQLVVTKGVTAGFTRQWSWTLDKAADQTALVLADGQLFQVNYQVTATATATDSAYAATGGISITNPHPTRAAQLTAVNDIASPGILGVVDCPTLTVAPAGTVQCTYAVDLPSGDPRLNTAVATRQAFSYDPSGTGTPAGTTDVTATAAVTFAGPTAEIDECVDVTDTDLGVLGTVCAGDAPTTFAYSLAFGRHADADVVLDCLENTHVNTASLVANDSGATASASWTVDATVACATGCTLTQGYWKTHSSLGPAPYDDAWASLGDADGDGVAEGADERFFTSGRTWYQVLWTSSTTPYYSLAHHYAAARLNVANGASSTTAVDAALAWAETFFATHSPASKLSKAEKSQLTAVATTLARYNLGLIGPGHCTE